ncbi:MAG: peptidoglycan recognition family protein [Pseudomonadota bacterium]|nr:peptidoglycan recognition family protein [Pseudomonadota bacterium]
MGTTSSRRSTQSDRQVATTGPARAPAKPPAKPKDPPPPPAGLFPGMGIQDETKEFGPLASRDREGAPQGVVLHRTESPTMESARNSYRTQIEKGNHVGAHYLVGKEGETSLTVPTDKVASHVRGNKDEAWKGANGWSVGIENVGMPSKIDPKKDIRAQVKALELPPAMKARLLGLSDKELKATLKDGGNEMHQDITGPQKRSNWNLVNALSKAHGFDIGTKVQAHEEVDHKTLGEGEPIKEFVSAMQAWPEKLKALGARIAKMQADPKHDPKALEQLVAQLEKDQATWAAVQADKTPAENTALDAEKILETPGPATAREADRSSFYKEFWPRSQALDKAGTPDKAPAS